MLTCPKCKFELTDDATVCETDDCPQCGCNLSSAEEDDAQLGSTELFVPAGSSDTSEAGSRKGQGLIAGRYTVSDRVGAGGYAEVFRVFDEKLQQVRAIKRPRQDRFGSWEAVRAFLHEARTAARLEHPGVVRVYDVNDEEDNCFIVMQFVDGESLRQRLVERERLEPTEACRLLAAVAESVSFAHRQGFVHRDLKPENILLDQSSRPFVADFGMAVHETELMAHAGEVSGTRSYMSPEQVRGEIHYADGRSDLWALGVVFYEMLSGRRPFLAETQDELFESVCSRPHKPLRQVDPDLPPELEAICDRCLQKTPADRYSNGQDLADDLRRWLQGHSDAATASNSFSPARPPRSSPSSKTLLKRLWPIAAAVLTAGAFVLLALAIWRASQARPSLDDVAQVDVPFRLLQYPPEELVWDSSKGHYEPDTKKGELTVAASAVGFLSLNETAASNYMFAVGISKSSWRGVDGLFWGCREDPSSGGRRRWRCDSVTFESLGMDGQLRHYLCRVHHDITREPDGHISLVREEKHRLEVEAPAIPGVSLRVEVKDGHVIAIRYQGSNRRELLSVETDSPPNNDSSTSFGVISAGGQESTFRDAYFILPSEIEQ